MFPEAVTETSASEELEAVTLPASPQGKTGTEKRNKADIYTTHHVGANHYGLQTAYRSSSSLNL